MEPLISIDHVGFSYNGERILDDISLDIHKGDFLGIIGPNGSGKTTLLKIIVGLLKPQTGKVLLYGKPNSEFRDWGKIGYVPQKAGSMVLHFPLTVEETVSMGRIRTDKLDDTNLPSDRIAVEQALKAVEMDQYKTRLLTELSGGQQQRVFIARALASEPELLLLDEPTVGVDVDSQSKFYQLLRDLNTRLQLTLVLISHDIEVVAHEVTEVACINSTLICHGRPKDIFKGNFMEKIYGKDIRYVVHGH